MKKKSAILRDARRLIRSRDPHFIYICDAIRYDYDCGAAQVEELCDWVSDLLNGAGDYAAWLCERHPTRYYDALAEAGVADEGSVWRDGKSNEVNSVFYEARLQWLDWMIDYWKARGE